MSDFRGFFFFFMQKNFNKREKRMQKRHYSRIEFIKNSLFFFYGSIAKAFRKRREDLRGTKESPDTTNDGQRARAKVSKTKVVKNMVVKVGPLMSLGLLLKQANSQPYL